MFLWHDTTDGHSPGVVADQQEILIKEDRRPVPAGRDEHGPRRSSRPGRTARLNDFAQANGTIGEVARRAAYGRSSRFPMTVNDRHIEHPGRDLGGRHTAARGQRAGQSPASPSCLTPRSQTPTAATSSTAFAYPRSRRRRRRATAHHSGLHDGARQAAPSARSSPLELSLRHHAPRGPERRRRHSSRRHSPATEQGHSKVVSWHTASLHPVDRPAAGCAQAFDTFMLRTSISPSTSTSPVSSFTADVEAQRLLHLRRWADQDIVEHRAPDGDGPVQETIRSTAS